MQEEVKHYKVKSLPTILRPNSVYYVKATSQSAVKTYITDQIGFAFPLIDLTSTVQTVTGTGVTGTLSNPVVNISTFKSSQLGNLIELSSLDGKLFVKPITSPDGSIDIVSTATSLEIQLGASLQTQIQNALQSGGNISELVNDVGYITLADIPFSAVSATAWTPNHTIATGNPYLAGTIVYYQGHIFQANFNNDSIVPTIGGNLYWTDLGVGYLIDQEQTDWLAVSGSAFIKNKPTNVSSFINDAGYLTSFTETDPVFSSWLSTNPLLDYVPYIGATQGLNLGYNTFKNNNGLDVSWENGGAQFGMEYSGDAKQIYFFNSDTSGNFNYSGQSIEFICNLEEGWGTTNWGYDFNDGTYFGSTIYNNVHSASFNTQMGNNNFSQIQTLAGEVSLTNLTDGSSALMESSLKLWKDYTQLRIANNDTSEANTIEMYTDRTYTKKYITTDEGYVGDYLQLNTAATEPVEVGKIVWNEADGTFDMGLLNNVTLQAGQEIHMYAKASGTISNGDAVQFAGAQGDHLLIKKAVPSEINANPEYFVGVATQDFATNDFGYVTVFGQVRGLDTDDYPEGTVLYYQSSGTTNGLLTDVRPTGHKAKIIVAAVVRSHITQGAIFVRPHVMPMIGDLQNVEISAATSGDVLTYNSSTQVWENKTLNEITGEFNYILTTPISFSGTAAETEVLRLELPPYTFAANDMLKIPTLLVQKTGTVNSYTIRVKLSTSATMPATTTDMVAVYNGTSTTTQVNMSRTWFLSGGILRGLGTSNAVTDGIGSTIQLNVAFDHTITNYLYISIDSAGGQDTQTLVGFQLTNR